MTARTTPAPSSTDRIEKRITLKAPRSRVWRALTDATEFGAWFNARLDGSFEQGTTVRGQITHPGYEHIKLVMHIEKVEPETLFTYRWHPYPIDPAVDYSVEQPTLVEFRLAEVKEGTELTVIESGFDALPANRKAEAFRKNEAGWGSQLKNIEAYVTR